MSQTVNTTNDILNKTQDAVNQQAQANKPAELIPDPREFPVHTQGYITNTMDMVKLVSSLFSVFKDYAGCSVYSYIGQKVGPNVAKTISYGSLYVDLYFKKNTSTTAVGMDNLIMAGESKGSSALSRLHAVAGGMHNLYNLNDDTKHILLKFLSGYQATGFNPMWAERVQEVVDMQSASIYGSMMGTNNYPAILKVSCLSLDAIVGAIYGQYDNDGNDDADNNKKKRLRYDYHCIPLATSVAGVNPMMYYNMQSNMSADDRAYSQQYVIQVLRNDRSIIEATQKAIGYTPMTQMNGYVPYMR